MTFLRAQGITDVGLRHKYVENKVKAYSAEELRALNAASTDEELQIWQFLLGTGFREGEVAHSCFSDVDFKLATVSVLEKRHWAWKPKDKEERTVPVPVTTEAENRAIMHRNRSSISAQPGREYLKLVVSLRERKVGGSLTAGLLPRGYNILIDHSHPREMGHPRVLW